MARAQPGPMRLLAGLLAILLATSAFAARDIAAHTAADYRRFGKDAAKVIAVMRGTKGGALHAFRLQAALRNASAMGGRISTNVSGRELTWSTEAASVRATVTASPWDHPGAYELEIESTTRIPGDVFRSGPQQTVKIGVNTTHRSLTVSETAKSYTD